MEEQMMNKQMSKEDYDNYLRAVTECLRFREQIGIFEEEKLKALQNLQVVTSGRMQLEQQFRNKYEIPEGAIWKVENAETRDIILVTKPS